MICSRISWAGTVWSCVIFGCQFGVVWALGPLYDVDGKFWSAFAFCMQLGWACTDINAQNYVYFGQQLGDLVNHLHENEAAA